MLLRLILVGYAVLLLIVVCLSVGYLAVFHEGLGGSAEEGTDWGNLRLLLIGLGLGIPAFVLLQRVRVPEFRAAHVRGVLAVILLMAAATRVLWLVLVPTDQRSDYRVYHLMAVGLATQGVFSRPGVDETPASVTTRPLEPTAYTMPGYPVLLAAGYRVFGPSEAWGYALNIMLLLGMQLALFYSIGRSASPAWGLFAAAAVGVHPSLVTATSALGTDLAGSALLVVSAALLLRSLTQSGAGAWLAAGGSGLSLGAAIHCRPFLLALGPLWLLGLCLRPSSTQSLRPTKLPAAAAFFLALSATLVPWYVRNCLVFGQPLFTTTANSFALFIDNIEEFSDPGGRFGPQIAEKDEIKAAAVARYQARAWIAAHPKRFIFRGARRIGMTFATDQGLLGWIGTVGPREAPRENLGKRARSLITAVCNVWWGILVGALLTGLWTVATQGPPSRTLDWPSAAFLAVGLFVLLLTMAAVFVAVAHPRYHITWTPFAYAALAVILGTLCPDKPKQCA